MVEKIRKEGFQSRNDLDYFLAELKESEPWLYQYHPKMLQMVSTQLGMAQKSLIKSHTGNKTGDLQFTRLPECHAFTYNQSGFELKNGFLHLSKIGKIKLIQHRQLSQNHTIKQITVSQSESGKWHVCLTCEIDLVLPKPPLNKVGIDMGIKNFTNSDGFAIPNPLNYTKMLKPLKRIQKKISRRQIGSNNYKKAVRFYQIIQERIKNRRRDLLHKLSLYAKKYDLVFVEKLHKLNMVQNHRLAKNILDSGWDTFNKISDYKTRLVEAPANNTTIYCSRCGHAVPKTLELRTHRCDVCGLILDHNSATNILKKLEVFEKNYLPWEPREVTPAEIAMRSRKQDEATALVWL
jgi:putative transposase